MSEMNIVLEDIMEANKFVRILSQYDGKFELSSDAQSINAKSILGVIALGLSTPLALRIWADSDTVKKIQSDLREFCVT